MQVEMKLREALGELKSEREKLERKITAIESTLAADGSEPRRRRGRPRKVDKVSEES